MTQPDPYDLARAEAMLAGYHARWVDDMQDLVVLGVELEFNAPLRNPDTGAMSRTWTLAGKLDVLVQHASTGAVNVVEHKHTSVDAGPGSDYLKRLRMDGQVTTYFAGATSLGHDVEACIYDVLVKPGLRPLKATPPESRKYTKDGRLYANQRERDETPDEYRARLLDAIAAEPNDFYLRANVVRHEVEMHEGMADIWETGRAMREAELAGRHPRNPDACVRYGRTCEFFDVCTGEGSLQDDQRYRRSARVHTELSGDTDRDGLPLLSTSRLSAYRACPRLHKHRYLDGYRPAVEADALRFGSLLHMGLEAWWRAASDEERLSSALAAVRSPVAPAPAVGAVLTT
jgi:hypothetical protein